MRRALVGAAILVALCVAYVLAHWALIEVGREVITLRTRTPEGTLEETRLWIVDDGPYAWIHGGPESGWMRRLRADPIVEVERGGETRQYRAVPVPEARERVLRLLREKYGVADRWVRLLSGGVDSVAVRLEPL